MALGEAMGFAGAQRALGPHPAHHSDSSNRPNDLERLAVAGRRRARSTAALQRCARVLTADGRRGCPRCYAHRCRCGCDSTIHRSGPCSWSCAMPRARRRGLKRRRRWRRSCRCKTNAASSARTSNGRAAPVARHDFRFTALRLDLLECALKMLRRAARGVSMRLRCRGNCGRKDDEPSCYCSSSHIDTPYRYSVTSIDVPVCWPCDVTTAGLQSNHCLV